jgi:hypothetical protein
VKNAVNLIIVFLFAYSSIFGQNCAIRLTGHVHSTTTHENLADSYVTLQGKSGTLVTDVNGDFRFENLCVGTYTLLITHASYDTIIRTVILTRSTHLDFDLLPAQKVLNQVTVTNRFYRFQTHNSRTA